MGGNPMAMATLLRRASGSSAARVLSQSNHRTFYSETEVLARLWSKAQASVPLCTTQNAKSAAKISQRSISEALTSRGTRTNHQPRRAFRKPPVDAADSSAPVHPRHNIFVL